MLLASKNAVVYGAGGSMGGAVARAFAREGARVILAGRTLAKLDRVAREGRSIEMCFNAVGLNDVQGIPLAEDSLDDFLAPVVEGARTHFLTATAAARRMTAQGSGVIIMLSPSAARASGPMMGGFSVACAAIECLTRTLAGEVGRHGVRVVALRPNRTPETVPEVSPVDVQLLVDGTGLGRLPRLAEVADTAAFLASDGAGAITGAVVNLTCGAVVD